MEYRTKKSPLINGTASVICSGFRRYGTGIALKRPAARNQHIDAEHYLADALDRLDRSSSTACSNVTAQAWNIEAPGLQLRRNITAIFDAYLGRCARPMRYSRSI